MKLGTSDPEPKRTTSENPLSKHDRVVTGRLQEQRKIYGRRFLAVLSMVCYQIRQCCSNQTAQANEPSWCEQLSAHRITFLTSGAALVVAIAMIPLLPPEISGPPLAVFGCALLALVVNGRWGTVAAISYCALVLIVKIYFHIRPFEIATLLWNFTMRFILLEIFVVLFDMVRRKGNSFAGK